MQQVNNFLEKLSGPIAPFLKEGVEDVPALGTDSGTVTLSSNGRTRRLLGGRFVAEARAVPELPDSRRASRTGSFHELDLSLYRVSGEGLRAFRNRIAYTPLERTGDVVLIQFINPGKGMGYATVNSHDRTFTQLDMPFNTTDERVHLVPGGAAVVVQEASHGTIAGISITTDRMAVLDAASGAVSRRWTEAEGAGWFLLTVTPKGQLTLYRGDMMRLGSGVVEAAAGKVVVLQNDIGPVFFYADR